MWYIGAYREEKGGIIMSDSQMVTLKSIDHKLSIMISLLAYQVVQKMTVAEGAPLLKRLGFTPTQIAAVFDSTAGAISVRLAEAKRKLQPRKYR
jgi:hypothetical protein